MRAILVPFLATLLLGGCKREAQEAVAQAKGAAADAERAAKQAAAQAQNAADQARSAADDAAAKARDAAASASDSARHGLDNASQSMRELTAGDQVQGIVVGRGGTVLDVRPGSGPVQTIRTDDRTRWILRGAAAGGDGFPIGSSVRVTYIVRNGQRVATQVEATPR